MYYFGLTMTKSNWWFAPEKLSDNLTELLPNATKIVGGCTQIKKAMQLSVYLNGVFVNKSYNEKRFGKGKSNTNNLMIASSFQTGTSPIVQRIHFYKENQESGKWVGNLFKSLVCTFNDFVDQHITLQCQVYDIKDLDKYREALDTISKMSGSLSVTFPIIAEAALAIPTAKGIIDVVDQFEHHIKIMDDNLKLEMAPENTGVQILQTGHWICFSEPQEDGLKVDSNLQVINKDGKTSFIECSYTTYSIIDTIDEEPNWEIDQKSAKLLSQLNGKGSADKAAIDFVKDTVEAYTKFNKLQRLQQLQNKKDLTDPEKALLERLKADKDLESFIPKDNKDSTK